MTGSNSAPEQATKVHNDTVQIVRSVIKLIIMFCKRLFLFMFFDSPKSLIRYIVLFFPFLPFIILVIFKGTPNMKKTKSLLLLILIFIISSCTLYCNGSRESHNPIKDSSLSRHSFVKIYKAIQLEICNPEKPKECVKKRMDSSGSGFIVRNDDDGSYIITAAHVCDNKDIESYTAIMPNVEITKRSFYVADIYGNKFVTAILNYDSKIDVCVAYTYGLYKPAVKISSEAPRPGDIVFNLAAPLGVFAPNMVPIMHGIYSGEMDDMAIYSVPAAGGSSGSGVFNSHGELIGLIHSVFVRFNNLSLSPTYEQLVDFIYNNNNKNKIIEKKLIYIIDLL